MLIDLIKYPIKVDKYQVKQLNNGNQVYTFKLDVRLTKPQIKHIFQSLFNIEILSVNTIITRKKFRRQKYKPRFKKAILTVPATVGPRLFANLETLQRKAKFENDKRNAETTSKVTLSSKNTSKSTSNSEKASNNSTSSEQS
jgi:ribosomal protein L23